MKEILEPTEEKSNEAYGLADVLMKLSEKDDIKKIIHFIFYEISLLTIELRELVDLLEEKQK